MMIGLLRAAQCPACDGSGTIARQISMTEYEPEQCQWCYERDLVLSHFDKIEIEENKKCKKTDDIPF
jgi:hypothetical protein